MLMFNIYLVGYIRSAKFESARRVSICPHVGDVSFVVYIVGRNAKTRINNFDFVAAFDAARAGGPLPPVARPSRHLCLTSPGGSSWQYSAL